MLEDEVEYVISKIYEILARETTYTYKDIAILSRANNHLDAFVLALKKHGIPYQLVGNRGLYDQEEIRDVIALLKIIINPKDSINLYRALNIDTFDIPQKDLFGLESGFRDIK
ncbi:3'-5' exonuclease, partial [Patescibacteria group bacterium]